MLRKKKKGSVKKAKVYGYIKTTAKEQCIVIIIQDKMQGHTHTHPATYQLC